MSFRQMGKLIAGTNFLVVIWWGIEVLLLWTVRSVTPGFAMFQLATRIFVFLVFAVTLVALRGGSVRALGIVFVAAVLAALAVRIWARTPNGAGQHRRRPSLRLRDAFGR